MVAFSKRTKQVLQRKGAQLLKLTSKSKSKTPKLKSRVPLTIHTNKKRRKATLFSLKHTTNKLLASNKKRIFVLPLNFGNKPPTIKINNIGGPAKATAATVANKLPTFKSNNTSSSTTTTTFNSNIGSPKSAAAAAANTIQKSVRARASTGSSRSPASTLSSSSSPLPLPLPSPSSPPLRKLLERKSNSSNSSSSKSNSNKGVVGTSTSDGTNTSPNNDRKKKHKRLSIKKLFHIGTPHRYNTRAKSRTLINAASDASTISVSPKGKDKDKVALDIATDPTMSPTSVDSTSSGSSSSSSSSSSTPVSFSPIKTNKNGIHRGRDTTDDNNTNKNGGDCDDNSAPAATVALKRSSSGDTADLTIATANSATSSSLHPSSGLGLPATPSTVSSSAVANARNHGPYVFLDDDDDDDETENEVATNKRNGVGDDSSTVEVVVVVVGGNEVKTTVQAKQDQREQPNSNDENGNSNSNNTSENRLDQEIRRWREQQNSSDDGSDDDDDDEDDDDDDSDGGTIATRFVDQETRRLREHQFFSNNYNDDSDDDDDDDDDSDCDCDGDTIATQFVDQETRRLREQQYSNPDGCDYDDGDHDCGDTVEARLDQEMRTLDEQIRDQRAGERAIAKEQLQLRSPNNNSAESKSEARHCDAVKIENTSIHNDTIITNEERGEGNAETKGEPPKDSSSSPVPTPPVVVEENAESNRGSPNKPRFGSRKSEPKKQTRFCRLLSLWIPAVVLLLGIVPRLLTTTLFETTTPYNHDAIVERANAFFAGAEHNETPMKGIVVVVSETESNLGKEIEARFDELGATVVASVKTMMDCTDLESVSKSVDSLVETLQGSNSKVDFLVHTGNTCLVPNKEEMIRERKKGRDFDTLYTGNYLSSFLVTQKLLPQLEQSLFGTLVQFTSPISTLVDGSELKFMSNDSSESSSSSSGSSSSGSGNSRPSASVLLHSQDDHFTATLARLPVRFAYAKLSEVLQHRLVARAYPNVRTVEVSNGWMIGGGEGGLNSFFDRVFQTEDEEDSSTNNNNNNAVRSSAAVDNEDLQEILYEWSQNAVWEWVSTSSNSRSSAIDFLLGSPLGHTGSILPVESSSSTIKGNKSTVNAAAAYLPSAHQTLTAVTSGALALVAMKAKNLASSSTSSWWS